jgi:succinyl-CoA synthetase beta subunit
MELHEYQAKSLFAKAGMRTQKGVVIDDATQCENAVAELGLPIVVKAQVHAGGRGKAGAIKFSQTADEVRTHVTNILGMTLKTKQTGSAGLTVRRVLLAQACDIASELYVSVLTDRETGQPVLIASRGGGMDIEETAASDPDAVLKLQLDPTVGIPDDESRRVHAFWCPDNAFPEQETLALLRALYRTYFDNDASMVEINPVAVTPEGELVAIDAKMSVDDNARFRHSEWDAFELDDEQDAREREAAQYGLSYIKVGEGSIGCMVNGAGLAMATMDVITLFDARPANFLDVGGGATAENVTAAFRILAGDPDVKAILVNIFGGIMRCDVIAEGVLTALRSVELDVPLIVRLEGTNVEEGRRMIAESGLKCQTASDLTEAARLAAEASGGGR